MSKVLTEHFCVLAVGNCDFDLLACLRRHLPVEEITKQQVQCERNTEEGGAGWTGLMDECKRELLCVSRKMAQAIG